LLTKNIQIKIYGTLNLPVVLYWRETWSLTFREERRLRGFENRALRRLLKPKRYEVTGEWKRLFSEELCDLYSTPNIIRLIKSRRMSWAGLVTNREAGEVMERDYLQDLRVDGRIMLKWIRSMDWIDVAQERDRSRFENLITYLRVPLHAGNFWTRRGPIGFSGRTLPHGAFN